MPARKLRESPERGKVKLPTLQFRGSGAWHCRTGEIATSATKVAALTSPMLRRACRLWINGAKRHASTASPSAGSRRSARACASNTRFCISSKTSCYVWPRGIVLRAATGADQITNFIVHRWPGCVLEAGEKPPQTIPTFVAEQSDVPVTALDDHARRVELAARIWSIPCSGSAISLSTKCSNRFAPLDYNAD